mmetsp:Transcript_20353/g.36374  ORF Transcript_20353/g.36374 Transcript_20353/m.36374 type:complete len:618 (+) Transcript_20353:73-1926(+)|eukprot:CAMPEP_0197662410 /NCGR_PEP_ID=MMETSP1338-20131121/53288_1 /TAXON_ID=43686 ORGANISM="Pelagodinium beii, Strain RCC1491" /NCGR_SAMPLE_ID=MMETSP1338 /ASSEMBLY_ACC=CAM_ASM_000754 /LENGTH=617 /DNA_ID=CAMNT_0043240253 /DNA_START=61 /DNA_END=1914 /DNA_ORIENTATION=+
MHDAEASAESRLLMASEAEDSQAETQVTSPPTRPYSIKLSHVAMTALGLAMAFGVAASIVRPSLTTTRNMPVQKKFLDGDHYDLGNAHVLNVKKGLYTNGGDFVNGGTGNQFENSGSGQFVTGGSVDNGGSMVVGNRNHVHQQMKDCECSGNEGSQGGTVGCCCKGKEVSCCTSVGHGGSLDEAQQQAHAATQQTSTSSSCSSGSVLPEKCKQFGLKGQVCQPSQRQLLLNGDGYQLSNSNIANLHNVNTEGGDMFFGNKYVNPFLNDNNSISNQLRHTMVHVTWTAYKFASMGDKVPTSKYHCKIEEWGSSTYRAGYREISTYEDVQCVWYLGVPGRDSAHDSSWAIMAIDPKLVNNHMTTLKLTLAAAHDSLNVNEDCQKMCEKTDKRSRELYLHCFDGLDVNPGKVFVQGVKVSDILGHVPKVHDSEGCFSSAICTPPSKKASGVCETLSRPTVSANIPDTDDVPGRPGHLDENMTKVEDLVLYVNVEPLINAKYNVFRIWTEGDNLRRAPVWTLGSAQLMTPQGAAAQSAEPFACWLDHPLPALENGDGTCSSCPMKHRGNYACPPEGCKDSEATWHRGPGTRSNEESLCKSLSKICVWCPDIYDSNSWLGPV